LKTKEKATVKEAWDALKGDFEKQSCMITADIWRHLQDICCTKYENIHFDDVCTMQEELASLGTTLSECQGFTKSYSGLGLNGLWLKGLEEYSDSYLVLDYLGPILESKWLVMQTIGNHLGLFWTWTFGGNLGEDVSGCHLDF
jgi:hypothetical protein